MKKRSSFLISISALTLLIIFTSTILADNVNENNDISKPTLTDWGDWSSDKQIKEPQIKESDEFDPSINESDRNKQIDPVDLDREHIRTFGD